jgi:ubiquinone/menaquinone biosynthesis C-methylase UbiE
MKSAQQFWDKAAARYARSPVKDEASYQKKLAITRDYFQPDWSVFEFGCGTGSTAILHAPYVRDILATDVSAKMLEIAEAKARDGGIDNIRFQQGTLDSLSLTPGSFDAVLGLNILHLVEDPEAAISRVSSLLKPGGVFVSNTVLADDMKLHWRLLIPLMQALGFAPHVSRFGKKGLLAMLARAGFDIDHEWQPDSLSVFIVARKRA